MQILIDASNGASDYGNKFGEPLIAGYTRAFGLRMPSGERREWIKPIMFRCGAGAHGCLLWHRPLFPSRQSPLHPKGHCLTCTEVICSFC